MSGTDNGDGPTPAFSRPEPAFGRRRPGAMRASGGVPSGGGGARDRAGKPRRDRIVAAGHCGNNVTKAKKLGLAVMVNVAFEPPAGFYGPSGFG